MFQYHLHGHLSRIKLAQIVTFSPCNPVQFAQSCESRAPVALGHTSAQNAEGASKGTHSPDDGMLTRDSFQVIVRFQGYSVALSDSKVTVLPFLCLTLGDFKDKTRAVCLAWLVKAPASSFQT